MRAVAHAVADALLGAAGLGDGLARQERRDPQLLVEDVSDQRADVPFAARCGSAPLSGLDGFDALGEPVRCPDVVVDESGHRGASP